MEEEHKRINHTIIQISFVTSNREELKSDHCIGVGAGERDCLYQHNLCFNKECSVANLLA